MGYYILIFLNRVQKKSGCHAKQMKELFVQKDRIAIELYLAMAAPLHGLLEGRLYRRTHDEKIPGKHPERNIGEPETYDGTLRQRKKWTKAAIS